MDHTSILLSNDTSNEEKIQSANEIINNNNLSLKVKQVLLAHSIMCNFSDKSVNSKIVTINRIFVFNKILNISANMYIAIILALCNNYHPRNLDYLMIFKKNTSECIDIGIGISTDIYSNTITYSDATAYSNTTTYCDLLDYYEFDISNMPNISNEHKIIIEEYRQNKYSGKLTKSAIKNEQ